MRATAQPPATSWEVVALAILAGAAAGLQVGKAPPSLPGLRAELGLDLVAAGWVASLFNAVGAAVGLFAGAAADRLGARGVTLACLGLLALGGLAGALAPNAPLLLAARLVESLGFVGVAVSGPKVILGAAAPADRGLALGAWGVYMPLGMAGAMLAAPPLLAAGGWRALWLAAAAAALVVLALFAWRAPSAPAAAGRFDWRAAGETLGRAGPWLLGACFACYSLQFFSVTVWLPTFLVERRGWAAPDAAVACAVVVAANALGNLASAWAMHRGVEPARLIAAAFLAMAAGAVLIFAAGAPDALRLPAAFAFTGLGGLLPAATLAAAPRYASTPAQAAIAGSVVVQCSNLGSLAGPPAMAATVGLLGGWSQAFWLNLGAGAAGLALAAALAAGTRRGRRRPGGR